MLTTITFGPWRARRHGASAEASTATPRTPGFVGAALQHMWSGSPALTATGLFMLVLLAGAAAGLILDSRSILGAPAWLKPAKFAASIAIYSLTLAWIFAYLPEWRRTRMVVAGVTTTTLLVEIAIIGAQSWRGTTSHFNVSTPLDAVMWMTMGLAIVVQTATSVAVAVALWKQPFRDAALGWALRLGMALTIVGAASGGLMTQPTAVQLADARRTDRMTTAGAHTIGGPDGGPGLPLTGWSRDHGDGRVAHFVGLHALQAMLLVWVALSRRALLEKAKVRLVVMAATGYAALFIVLSWQALKGLPLLHPDASVLAALIGVAAATGAAGAVVSGGTIGARRQPE